MGNRISCSASETPTGGNGCPEGFAFKYDCQSSWIFYKVPANARCELENPTRFISDWPEGLGNDYFAPVIQGSSYNTVGVCSGGGTAWSDESKPAPACNPGDTDAGTIEAPCGNHLFGTYGTAGGRQLRSCKNKSPTGQNSVISVNKRSGNCEANSGYVWSFDPEWSCDYQEKLVSGSDKSSAILRRLCCFLKVRRERGND